MYLDIQHTLRGHRAVLIISDNLQITRWQKQYQTINFASWPRDIFPVFICISSNQVWIEIKLLNLLFYPRLYFYSRRYPFSTLGIRDGILTLITRIQFNWDKPASHRRRRHFLRIISHPFSASPFWIVISVKINTRENPLQRSHLGEWK